MLGTLMEGTNAATIVDCGKGGMLLIASEASRQQFASCLKPCGVVKVKKK
jgi:hypothetical protein